MLTDGSLDGFATRVLDQLPIGVLGITPDDKIGFANHVVETILGRSSALLLDRPLDEVVPAHSELGEFLSKARAEGGVVSARNLPWAGSLGGVTRVDATMDSASEGVSVLSLSLQRALNDADPAGESATMAEVARILGHEVKNPLAGMVGAAQLLKRQAREDQQALLTVIKEEGDRITRIIDRFTAFETFFRPRPISMNIHALLKRVMELAEPSEFAADVQFKEEFDPSLPEILADPDHLHEAVLNIIKNACEAMKDTDLERVPSIIVETRYRSGIRLIQQDGHRLRSGAAEITISDNGPGLPADVKSRMFSPFFTTKKTGAGIGLSVVAEIMSAHGGFIEVDSSGEGTAFRLLLPLDDGVRQS